MAPKTVKAAHDNDATQEIYELARQHSDQELAAMRDGLNAVHTVGLISGRAQAFNSMKLIAEFLEYKQVAQIVDNEDYLKIPGVSSIDDYFEKLGLGRSTAFKNLKIARALTVEEVQLLGQVGFTRRDLLSYASLPEEKRLEIREGKVINIESASREEIKDVIEEVIAEAHRTKEEADAQLSAKDKVLKSKEDVINKQERELKKFERDAAKKGLTVTEDAFIQRMDNLRTTFDGLMLQIEPDYMADLAPDDGGTPRMTAAYLTTLDYARKQLMTAYQRAEEMYGDATMCPEDAWTPPVKG